MLYSQKYDIYNTKSEILATLKCPFSLTKGALLLTKRGTLAMLKCLFCLSEAYLTVSLCRKHAKSVLLNFYFAIFVCHNFLP